MPMDLDVDSVGIIADGTLVVIDSDTERAPSSMPVMVSADEISLDSIDQSYPLSGLLFSPAVSRTVRKPSSCMGSER